MSGKGITHSKKYPINSDFYFLQQKEKLRIWFNQFKRDLPFRKIKDPYQIWVSEVMLQQTRMNSMLPLYKNFISNFPDVFSLSNASEEKVLGLWRGLGYYSRALNLKKGALYVVNFYNGKIPSDLNSLLKIPGIGPYTARAIASIAFGQKYAVLDGNVKRVIARLFLFKKSIQIAQSINQLQKLADDFLNVDFPGEHNEAMMELGATICNQKPDCARCPLIEICLSRKSSKENTIPLTTNPKNKIQIELHFLLLKYKRKILILKNKKRRFFKTIFSPPYLINGDQLPFQYKNDENINELFRLKNRVEYKNVMKHSITNHEIKLMVSQVNIGSKIILNDYESKWVSEKYLEKEFHSSIAGKIKKIMGQK